MGSQDAIWTYFQNQAIESFASSRARLDYLLRQVQKRHPSRVLNIGIGAGIFEGMAKERGVTISSLDPDTGAVQRLCSQFGIDARQGYAQRMPFESDYFGAVVASEVLEHFDDDSMAQALSEIRRVLVPGGYFIGTVPHQEDLLESLVVCPYCGEHFHRWGHEQSFSINKMEDVLEPYFVVDRVFLRMFVTFSALNWKGKITSVVKLLLWKLGIHRGKPNLVFIARKPGAR